jgi:pimeloyl-ACP methyl ester carboxylesterase
MSLSINSNTPEMYNNGINLLNKAVELAKDGKINEKDLKQLEDIAKSDGNFSGTEKLFIDSLKTNAKEFVEKVKASGFEPSSFSWNIEDKAPHLRVLPHDLNGVKEVNELSKADDKGSLFAVAGKDGKYHPERTPVIIVHGIAGNFDDDTIKPLIDRFKDDPTKQVYVFGYHDIQNSQDDNGVQMAKEIKDLLKANPEIKNIDIVAHSMGGIVSKRALNELYTGSREPIDNFKGLNFKFVAVDSPFHGYFPDEHSGPRMAPRNPGNAGQWSDFMSGDNSLPSSGTGAVKTDGFGSMKADRKLFTGDPDSQDKAVRAGLTGVKLPENVEVQLFSAKDSGVAKDAQKYIGKLNDKDVIKLARALRDGKPEEFFKPSQLQELNYFKMMMQDSDWPKAQAEIADMLELEPPNQVQQVKNIIEKYMPSFKGGHSEVLKNPLLLDKVQDVFNPRPAGDFNLPVYRLDVEA